MIFEQLKERALLEISGEDRFKFLQNIISNDAYKLEKDEVIYSLILSPRGKFLFDFFAYRVGEVILLEYYQPKKAEFLENLQNYKLRAKIAIKELPEYKIIVTQTKPEFTAVNSVIDPRLSDMGYRVIVADIPTGQQTSWYEVARMRNLIAEGEKDMEYGRSFPLEFGMQKLHAIDFAKGCYVGQEVTTRMHHRLIIRKKLVLLESDHAFPPRGTKIDEKHLILSSCKDNSKFICLALYLDEDLSHHGEALLRG